MLTTAAGLSAILLLKSGKLQGLLEFLRTKRKGCADLFTEERALSVNESLSLLNGADEYVVAIEGFLTRCHGRITCLSSF